jgi:hypothetical protein
MTKLFISDLDFKLKNLVAEGLVEKGYEITSQNFEVGVDLNTSIKNIIKNADVFIILITKGSVDSKRFLKELIQLRNYTIHSNKIIIPVFEKGVDLNRIPDEFQNIQGVQFEGRNIESIDLLLQQIDNAINQFLGKKLAKEEKAQVIKDKIESSYPEYINETITGLTKREKNLKNTALFWYILGFTSLLSGVGAALIFSNNGLKGFEGNAVNWSKTVFFAIKSIIIIVLLISASKYSFNLAKSYMNESLKISDRIHAISFGKFYLQVFNQQIEPSELKEIFQNWNITTESSFIHQKSKDFDPQILEKIIELIDKVRNNKSA